VRLPAVVVVVLLTAAWGPGERHPVTYDPPVNGPVADGFRPPSSRYGPGNRGIDYATRSGEAVRASAPGEVVFAGRVGDSLHVVVLHGDGIRTSYSFLRSVRVARGHRVTAGATVGTAGASLHFGARAGDAYIDPAVLLAGDRRVHLIPDGTTAPPPKPESEAAERAGLAQLVWGGVSSAGKAAGRGAVHLASVSASAAKQLPPVRQVRYALDGIEQLRVNGFTPPRLPGESEIRSALAVAREVVADRECTPAHEAAAVPNRRGRIALLVGGLGSSSDNASIDDVDTSALGYDRDHVMRFSYRGGTTNERRYQPADTLGDIRLAGRRLRHLLERLQYEHPGVPVDLIAHSQGGLVARSALGDELDPFDPRTPRVDTLITLATPHHGANLATAAALLRHTKRGPLIERVAGTVARGHGLDPRSPAIHQLAETSDFLRELNKRPLPNGVRATSIAARRDVVVPSPKSRLRGARNVVVALPGVGNDHANLPGSREAQREMALALAGKPASCETAADVAADSLWGHAIDRAEQAGGVAAAAASEGAP
jgi:hypothetical protein